MKYICKKKYTDKGWVYVVCTVNSILNSTLNILQNFLIDEIFNFPYTGVIGILKGQR